MYFEGVPARPYISGGDRFTWKVLAEYNWSPTIARSGSFLHTAASSTPTWVVTREIRYIYELSLTLEHSMATSSRAAPGLTGKVPVQVRPTQWVGWPHFGGSSHRLFLGDWLVGPDL